MLLIKPSSLPLFSYISKHMKVLSSSRQRREMRWRSRFGRRGKCDP
ncbi:unnamed protein product [Arabidopsis lyrata]|nr:unnamed protein product [Arabidopsis lyrata]